MKVFVINLRRVKRVVSVILLLTLSVLVTSWILFAVDAAFVGASASPPDGEKTIILDPGHGGEDSGAVGANGKLEKDLNLEIALELKSALEKQGFKVILTRSEDKMLYTEDENIKGMRKLSDLKNRCKIAAEYPGATMISIHMNSFGASQYSGTQVYYTSGCKDSELLAASIQKSVKELVQAENNRVIKNGKGLYLLDNSSVTTVLVECGFLSNLPECEKLSQKEYQKELSFAIVCGIIEYMKN